MDYVRGIFRKRPNRFIAEVDANGAVEIAHVPNTGRCKELLVEDAVVWLKKSDNPRRKTKFTLHFVENRGELVSLYSQEANSIVYDAIVNGQIKELTGYNNYERGEFGKLIQKTHKEDNNKRSEWDKNIIEKNFIIKYSDNEDEIKQTIFNIVNKALTEKLDGEAPKKAFSLIFKTKAQAETARTKEKYNEELKGTDI